MPLNNKKVISIDGMGGDKGPEEVILGIQKAYVEIGDENLKFLIFIPRQYEELCQDIHFMTDVIFVEDVIDPQESPLRILKKGLKTTMGRSIQAVADKEADAVFSSGATGSYITLCWKILNLIPDIHKIALPALIPSANGFTLMLDLGASLVVSEKDLVQFAIMGNAMARILLKKNNPKIGLLNVGTEEIKGLPQTIQAHKLLKEMDSLNYYGFVEGNQIFSKDVDVIITDGYAGNIALKTMKGCEVYFNKLIKEYLTRDFLSKLLSLGALFNIKQLKADLDWRQYNGAPLLGFSQLAMKGHGDSDHIAIAAGIKMTYTFIQNNLIEKITDEVSHNKRDIIVN